MNWWQRLWHRKQREQQLDKELHLHLEQHANELIACGQNPEEARRLARLAHRAVVAQGIAWSVWRSSLVRRSDHGAVLSASLARQRFLVLLFAVFATLALLLACVGIYGVLAYLTGQRVPEIGVRIALGARPVDVMWMVLRQGLGMILAGIAAGVLVALAAGHVLQHLVEGMRPAEISTFAITISLLIAAALFASFVPARRASRIDPITALRQE